MSAFRTLLNASRYSIRGFLFAARTERAFRQELVVCVLGAVAGLFLADSIWKYVLLMGVIIATMTVELLNTAIEKLCDRLLPDQDETVGHIKDMGSAAVFLSLSVALAVWLVTIVEYFLAMR